MGFSGTKLNPDEYLYNYDTEVSFIPYCVKGRVNMDYVIYNTVILHFCGKQKPWHPNYKYRFGVLYKYYQKMVQMDEAPKRTIHI